MKKNFIIAIWFTLVTTLIFGVLYPLAVTGLSQLFFPKQANGQLIERNGKTVGSAIIGQSFSGPGYFHSRGSNAGSGYDAMASSGSNLAPTNKVLIERVKDDVRKAGDENPGVSVPIDLVTTSGSGLDPEISPATAEFQIPRIARERHVSPGEIRLMVSRHASGRQFGVLGEPRVNVLELNLELDSLHPQK